MAATLFACGSHNDVSADTIQIIHVFDAAKSVCCDELHEQCDDSSSTLPNLPHARLCPGRGCRGASCAPAFAADGFLGMAFKPQLDQLMAKCKAAEQDPTPTYVISDPALGAGAITTCHGRVIDVLQVGLRLPATNRTRSCCRLPLECRSGVRRRRCTFRRMGTFGFTTGQTSTPRSLACCGARACPRTSKTASSCQQGGTNDDAGG